MIYHCLAIINMIYQQQCICSPIAFLKKNLLFSLKIHRLLLKCASFFFLFSRSSVYRVPLGITRYNQTKIIFAQLLCVITRISFFFVEIELIFLYHRQEFVNANCI